MIFIDLIFYARIVAIINEIKIQLQTRPAGWGTKSSCRGCRPLMKIVIIMMTWPFELWRWHLLWCEFRCWRRGQEDWRCWAAFASLEKLRQRDNGGFHYLEVEEAPLLGGFTTKELQREVSTIRGHLHLKSLHKCLPCQPITVTWSFFNTQEMIGLEPCM